MLQLWRSLKTTKKLLFTKHKKYILVNIFEAEDFNFYGPFWHTSSLWIIVGYNQESLVKSNWLINLLYQELDLSTKFFPNKILEKIFVQNAERKLKSNSWVLQFFGKSNFKLLIAETVEILIVISQKPCLELKNKKKK